MSVSCVTSVRHLGYFVTARSRLCVCAAGALFMLGVLGVYRCCTKRREFSYERVAHSLDEEEQAFKRTLEMQVRSREVPSLANHTTLDSDTEISACASLGLLWCPGR